MRSARPRHSEPSHRQEVCFETRRKPEPGLIGIPGVNASTSCSAVPSQRVDCETNVSEKKCISIKTV